MFFPFCILELQIDVVQLFSENAEQIIECAFIGYGFIAFLKELLPSFSYSDSRLIGIA